MVKSKIKQISEQRTGKLSVTFEIERSFLENYPLILSDIGIDVDASCFPKKKTHTGVGLINYDNGKNYDIDIIFFPEFILMNIRAKSSQDIENFKKALLKYAKYK